MNLVDELASAIAAMEGWNKAGSIARRNNNPGNLRTWGATPTEGGYAKFATEQEGWTALRRQIERNIQRGLNLFEFFGGKEGVYPGYAPAADSNRPVQYAQYVAGRVGIDPSVPLSQASPPNPMPGRPKPSRRTAQATGKVIYSCSPRPR